MFFKQLATKESSLSYFFGFGGLDKAVAVDVGAGDENWFIEHVTKETPLRPAGMEAWARFNLGVAG